MDQAEWRVQWDGLMKEIAQEHDRYRKKVAEYDNRMEKLRVGRANTIQPAPKAPPRSIRP